MARPKSALPQMRAHLSGQGFVRIGDRNFYLGRYGSPESLARYAVLISEYHANNLTLPDDFDVRAIDEKAGLLLSKKEVELPPEHLESKPITVIYVTEAYRQHILKVYSNSKSDLQRMLGVCSDVSKQAGTVNANEYGPLALQAQRQRWVESGKSRKYCNTLTNTAIRMFRWAVSQELIEPNVLVRLGTIEPLREGRTEAPETSPVKPVSLADVRATAKELPPVLKAMLRIHVATGMRPSELCNMKPCEIDKSGPEWMYRPSKHKNRSKGKTRAIPILGDSKEALIDYLNRDPQSYCFSPAESVAWHQATKRVSRKTKVQPSQVSRSKENPQVQPGDHYTQDSYRRAIARAAKRATVPQWFPYQLRHLNLTEIRDALGVEHAQAMGGHSRIDMTEVYAKQSERKAIEAAKAAPKL
ncbi:MAG TPA: site-specific integrase [Pirellula sp.]|nr:site-specific integrase [Pirellula sp.]